jgi:exodeoxyribonuclease VII small subunit
MAKSPPESKSEIMTPKDATPPASTSVSDELARLEEIVRRLEAEDLELDAALALIEEGVARLRAARERLAAAELKVQAVLEDASGELRFTKIDA